MQFQGGVTAQYKPLGLMCIQRLCLAVEHPTSSALHQEGRGSNVPALQAIAHPAIHVALGSPLGDEAHIQRHRATNAKRLLKPPVPFHRTEMLSEGVTRRIIEDETGFVEATNVSDMHGMAIDGGFCPGDGTVEFVVKRMVHDPYEGLVRTGQRDRDARKILPTDVRLGAIQGIDNPGIRRGSETRTGFFADDGVIGTVATENIADSHISERIDIGDDFLAVFEGNFQGCETMLEQDPSTDDGGFLGHFAKFIQGIIHIVLSPLWLQAF